ncbi:MAG: hemin receptor [Burkholderiales bacterium]|nr:hemin receptor [Burkholderiales bacterium]
MTPEDVRIVQRSWVKVLCVRDEAARGFYTKLFEIDPSTRQLFRGGMHAQGEKLMQVMDAAVNGLGRVEHIVPAVRALGRRHAGYGVKRDHYGAVGSALLWTLGEVLGKEFTPQVKSAWATVYAMLAAAMQEGADSAQTPGSAQSAAGPGASTR